MGTIMVVPMVSPYGIVDMDDNGSVQGFREKVEIPYWINAGVVWRSLREEAKLLFNAKLLAELRAENRAVKQLVAELGDEYREAFPDKFTDPEAAITPADLSSLRR